MYRDEFLLVITFRLARDAPIFDPCRTKFPTHIKKVCSRIWTTIYMIFWEGHV